MKMKMNKKIKKAIAQMYNDMQGKKDDKWSRVNHFNSKWGYYKKSEYYDKFQGKIGSMSFEYRLHWPENRDSIEKPNGTFDLYVGEYDWCKNNLIYPDNVIGLEEYKFSCRNIMKFSKEDRQGRATCKDKPKGYITKECLELLDLFEKDNSNIEYKKHISIGHSNCWFGTKSDIGTYVERHRYFVPIYE